MGAFLLYRTAAALDVGGAEAIFARKGLPLPMRIDLGEWRLLLCRKQLAAETNYIRAGDARYAFCVGTLCYRSLGSRASLERLLHDHALGVVDQDELLGNFCVGFWDGRLLELLTDGLNAQHVFVNEAGTCLSSSFLAVLASSPTPLRINRLAVLEKLASGYVLGPDTLVEGILQLNPAVAPKVEARTGLRILTGKPPASDSDRHHAGFAYSVRAQLEVLQDYFRRIETLATESRVELGLSSGFDSRLLLALSQSFPRPIPLHSHLTLKVHESELAVARTLAAIGNHALTIVPTERLEDQSEACRRAVIVDNLYFFDGRCIHDMGHCSETYTAQYRRRVLGDNRLSLHGLGGELFRNVYGTPPGRFDWDEWVDYAIFFPFAREACGSADAFAAMRRRRNEKIAGRLGADLSGVVDAHLTRCYYGLVRMPDCASNVSNAYNQVAFTLTPFIEPLAVREALKATPYIGCDGEYEAAMIRELAPRLAAVDSQYGHSFSSIPARYLLKARVTASIPLRWRVARRRRLCAAGRQRTCREGGGVTAVARGYIGELEEVLHTAFPQSDWSLALCEDSQRRTSLFVASFLREFHHKLRF